MTGESGGVGAERERVGESPKLEGGTAVHLHIRFRVDHHSSSLLDSYRQKSGAKVTQPRRCVEEED